MNSNNYLIVAGCCSIIAAVLHLCVIVGGPDWYRFFGAGEQMAKMAESGSLYPTVVTSVIAAILLIWGLYGFSAAGLIGQLPLMKAALSVITFVYLARGLAGLTLPFLVNHPAITQNSITFWVISSVVCLSFGGFYLVGTILQWSKL